MKTRKYLILCVLTLLSFFLLTPLWLLLSGSLMGGAEAAQNFAPVLEGAAGSALWPILPKYPTLQPLVRLLLDSPEFFRMFWNSCAQVFPLVAGQILLGAPAAWAFARYDFKGKRALFLLYIVLMLMPFQVTMVSSYLALDSLKLMDTVWAVILPGAASTFPVFIMTRFFAAIPDSLTEAAALDGAGPLRVFLRVGLPMGAPGILSAVVLGFFEYWNALEVPLTFLKDQAKWPLSLYLPSISADHLGISLMASVVMLAPALLIFLFGQKYLEQGICAAGLKDG
ncbi:MAG: carbohydrate ABC transporter permease [Oscillospiraceae bacterium]|jgi:multiple sugar transport system permease protein|nr:carbohydrate ABC transporter permease [Oscillospiraceae bacterium]